MKKEYFAPELQEFRFATEGLMVSAGDVVDPDDSSLGGDDDVTELRPMINIFN